MTLADFYKIGHVNQYPEGTEYIYSNFTPRKSRIEGRDKVVLFGLQYFIKEYLIKQFNDNFFNLEKEEVLKKYTRRIGASLGSPVKTDHIEKLHDLGYLPLHIKSIFEGSTGKMGVPLLTIVNTKPEFFWVTNFIESVMSCVLWGCCTSATTAFEFKNLFDKYAGLTSDALDFTDFQGHDFSFRGTFGVEAAMMSGAAHLLSFKGTDTIPAIDFLEEYYNADCEKEMVGVSVPATEHSVMCAGGKFDEKQTFKRLITETYPSGIVSIVSDTWNYWEVLTRILPELKDIILNRNGKIVIRPDSGDPELIICGDPNAQEGTPENYGTIQLLYKVFGGKINSKGYMELNEKIGIIYGDSITQERAASILSNLKEQGVASTNIVFGIGSFTYQYVTRDTFNFAVKSTNAVVKGKSIPIFKDPITDSGMKKSAKGLLLVDGYGDLHNNVSEDLEKGGSLKTVFKDGELIKDYSLTDLRDSIKRCK